ncbi:MAG: MBOAT family O-acyltransferase, partial [Flavobacteriales bacterium]
GDFSGYSDIALGTAKLFGFELLSNFRFPYFSRDIAEFWRRWHISLSSWFRDYLYIPLGGSKEGKSKAVRNTFIIFLVSGFWHGASWNFIIWGFIHACGFLPLLLLNRNRIHTTDVVAQYRFLPSFKEFQQMFLTFVFVTLAWIFFRAETLEISIGYLKQIGNSILHEPAKLLQVPGGKMAFIYIIPLLIGDWYLRRDERKLKVPESRWLRYPIYIILSLIIYYFFILSKEEQSFIYFQF